MVQPVAIKQEPCASLIPNVKYDPDQESGLKLKIKNVFSLNNTETVGESLDDLNAQSRSSNEYVRAQSRPQNSNDQVPDPEAIAATGRRYSLRKRSVKNYTENYDEPKKISSPAQVQVQNRKEKSKSIKQPEILACDICSGVFFSQESLEDHVVEVHVVDKEFNCTECSKSFISQERLDSHMTEHERDKGLQSYNKCPICSKIISPGAQKPRQLRDGLRKHMMTHQDVKSRPFKCKLCPKSFLLECHLKVHEMNQHGKPKKFKCPKCSKSFALNYVLEDHIRTHYDAKTMVCQNCGATFKTKNGLRKHRVYCGGPRSKNKSFSRKNVAGNHARDLESNGPTGDKNSRRGLKFRYKTHKCSVCKKVFMSNANLQIHMVIHSDGRNFKCTLCSMSFKRNQDVRTHLKSVHKQKL